MVKSNLLNSVDMENNKQNQDDPKPRLFGKKQGTLGGTHPLLTLLLGRAKASSNERLKKNQR